MYALRTYFLFLYYPSEDWFLSTSSIQEVNTGKLDLPEVFVQTERRSSEVCAKKQKTNTFPYRPSKRGSFSCLFIDHVDLRPS